MNSDSFAHLLARHASRREIQDWFARFKQTTPLSNEGFLELVIPVACAATDLEWMDPGERGIVKLYILGFVTEAFTIFPVEHHYRDELVQQRMQPFLKWLGSQPERVIVDFCWGLLAHEQGQTPEPIRWLRSSGVLTGAIEYKNIELGVSLANEADTMYWWPDQRWAVASWGRDSPPYFALLEHSSYVVRAPAARVLGGLFFGTKTRQTQGSSPSLADILSIVRSHEVRNAGVAGPFLQGAEWSVETEAWSRLGANLNMKEWFIETLRHSRREPSVPHMQSLEFYAHEFFARDASAIGEFLKMGRRDLAVMTATEEPEAIPELRSVLTKMTKSRDRDVAAAIREYMRHPQTHGGTLRNPEEEIS